MKNLVWNILNEIFINTYNKMDEEYSKLIEISENIIKTKKTQALYKHIIKPVLIILVIGLGMSYLVRNY